MALESVQMGRRSFAADASLYAITLTKGKLRAPSNLDEAYAALDSSLFAARSREVDIRKVPMWVRDFYHPDTLKEMLQLLAVLRKRRNHFLLACLLGISHHQRPGSSLILVVISYPILDPENFLEMTIQRCTHIGAWSLASEQRLHAH